MENVVLTVHLILALLLIGVVLLQRSEGGGLGMGGGSGVMTGRQAANALTRATWTALLARGASGGTPLIKVGSGGNGVRRVQRALNAATGANLVVDGVFGVREMAAVKRYQRRTDRSRTGVVAGPTWRALRRGVTDR